MKYAIKVLENHYKNMISLVSANAENKEEYSKLRLKQNSLLDAIGLLNEINKISKIRMEELMLYYSDCHSSTHDFNTPVLDVLKDLANKN